MNKSFLDLRIVFFGTPDFAVASLKGLIDAGCSVVAVVTAPDKPAGRGLQLTSTPVKEFATSHNIPVLQPVKLKDPVFLDELKACNGDLHIIVAFRMLPEVVWNMPPLGTINVHASLLPQYRGAAPINRAIMDGATETGVTTFKLKHAIDTGNILLSTRVDISPDDNAGTLHDKLMQAGADLLIQTVRGLADGSLQEVPQPENDTALRYAPKIFKEDTRINWEQPVTTVYNHIRGLSPYPAAFTILGDKNIKIYQSDMVIQATNIPAGKYGTDYKTFLRFAAADGRLYIQVLQQEGKKKMDIQAFLRGFRD